MRLLLVLTLCVLGPVHSVWAQPAQQLLRANGTLTAPPAFDLDEVMVTAAPVARPVMDTPRAASVITAEEIAASPGLGLRDLLAREAGIQVRSLSDRDRGAVVDIRGMGDTAVSNVQIYVDGAPLNGSDLRPPDLSSISLAEVERIEILRGASATLYGDGAVGGVVNIITRQGYGEP